MAILLREYLTDQGQNPYRIWLEKLDRPVRARIQARLLRFESGNLGDHKAVGEGLWEARLTFGSGYRVYFGKRGDELVLLLLGGDKSSQARDIARATNFWTEYNMRKDHE